MLKNGSWTLAVAVAAALGMAACSETLKGGNACPSLCPEQTLDFKDTVFDAADVIDTAVTVTGTPPIGTELQLLVAQYAQTGDSVVSVAVFRFDSIARSFPQTDTTVPPVAFTSADSSFLNLSVLPPPTGQDTIFVEDTVTFNVYNVYVNAPDLDTAQVRMKFTGVPVGTRTLPRDSVNGRISIPLDTSWVTQQVTTGGKVWLGVQVVCKKNARVTFTSANGASTTGGLVAGLSYLGRADTLKISTATSVNAFGTVWGPAIPAMADYQMVLKGSPPVPAGLLGLGGLPGHRVLIRFKFPAWLVDSATTVVRANLELQQVPFTTFQVDGDSVALQPFVTVAGPDVTDLTKVALLIGPTGLRIDSLPPAGNGLDSLALVRTGANTFTFWRFHGAVVQRAIVLAMIREGLEPRQVLFYGPTASPALRPKVHVSYVPHSDIGLP